jgi:hypothetical protein
MNRECSEYEKHKKINKKPYLKAKTKRVEASKNHQKNKTKKKQKKKKNL